ncbi:hypothetical protein HAX54_022064 [Datura stramonium]|uniref:Pentatricopeptide repeat-containing protein n=1 Tax=Datura stramonium TaxID=4076 RepID=A0ABS8S433_DATST|nr:hypothetical protein [Datura stramonium]
MTAEDYSKAIVVSGGLKNVDLAAELFKEASNKQLKSTSLYNALMTAYMCSGLAVNVSISFWGLEERSNMYSNYCNIQHTDLGVWRITYGGTICSNVGTYNYLIAGYITAWMWDDVEKTYRIMRARSIKPDLTTHLLMLRGYAHSDKLDKMEEIYELVKVDKLANFVSRAECAGWKICWSIYHCKSAMYASQRQLIEMERVLNEMDKVNLDFSKKSFWILLKAYTPFGKRINFISGYMSPEYAMQGIFWRSLMHKLPYPDIRDCKQQKKSPAFIAMKIHRTSQAIDMIHPSPRQSALAK